MKISSLLIIALFTMITPINVNADHGAVERIDEGHEIRMNKPFPTVWLKVGSGDILNKMFHSGLRSKYRSNYRESKDEGYFGIFCGVRDGIAILIQTSELGGQRVEYSATKPRFECKPISVSLESFKSGTGLVIGMDKSIVSDTIGLIINENDDIVSVKYDEVNRKKRIWHFQTLRLVFQHNKLINYSVSDFIDR
jgi:hypothetical protein